MENEITREINREIFESKKSEFTKKYGNPKVKKRLGMMVFDRNNPEIDTRIRITNGSVEIMQKVTKYDDNHGHAHKQEISIPLPSDVEIIYNTYITYSNLLLNKYSEKLIRLLVQTENYIWHTDEFELKLSHQFGKNDYYTYEIEALKDETDVLAIEKELELKPTENFSSQERKDFRTTKVDFPVADLSEKEIKDIINRYL